MVSVILLLLSIMTYSSEKTVYQISHQDIVFQIENNILISKVLCKENCSAPDLKKICPPKQKKWHHSQGSRVCEELSGKTVFGRSMKGSHHAFCLLKSGLLIETNSIKKKE